MAANTDVSGEGRRPRGPAHAKRSRQGPVADGKSLHDALARAQRTGKFVMHGSRLRELPSELRAVTDLRELLVTDCGLSRLPEWLAELTSLEIVDLAGNPLFELPEMLGLLPRLRSLGLSGTHLAELGRHTGHLKNLEILVLSGNNLLRLPSEIGDLDQLELLDLGLNALESLPESFSQLQNLRGLWLWGHDFQEFPYQLKGLARLETLDLSAAGTSDLLPDRAPLASHDFDSLQRIVGAEPYHTTWRGRLTEVPEWLESAFPALRYLYLGRQILSRLPATMPSGLQGFYASDNEIVSVPHAFALMSDMLELDLRRNRISELPVSLSAWARLDYLDLAGNPLPLPPEVLAQREEPAAIVEYVSRTLRLAKPLDEAKLLVVGEGSVGKSSLIKRLVDGVFDPQQGKTDGIDVTRWPIDVNGVRVILNVWDFGGQEIMHATHQFFLTERSVYVLVLDVRQGEAQNRLEYWLKLIQSFSGGSPVIVVGNKTDQASLDIDVRGLMTKYPNIVTILPASCCTGGGLVTVRETLVDVVAGMDHVHDLLPGSFFDIKNELEQLEENYLPFTEYQELCRRHSVSSKVTQELLVKFLHDLGTVVCFRDDPRLSDTNILNPAWVTGGVYKILNAHLSAQRKGLLSWTHINQILAHDDYPPERRQFIVEMMKRFELCYESDGVFLVPDLLTKEEPDTGVWTGALDFEISYDVLPTSILSRLMVRMHSVISKGTVWRTGVVFAIDHNRALVKADLEDAMIKISVSGPENGRRGLLTAIRTELRAIEKTIPGLAGEERVPVPGRPGIWVPYQHLVELEAAGRREVVPQGLSEDFDIVDLLAGVEARARVRTEVLRAGLPRRGLPVDPGVGDSGRAWSPREGMSFAAQLLIVLVVATLLAVFSYRQVGATAALGICMAAIAAATIIGIFALRSTGRLSETRFARILSDALRRQSGT